MQLDAIKKISQSEVTQQDNETAWSGVKNIKAELLKIDGTELEFVLSRDGLLSKIKSSPY